MQARTLQKNLKPGSKGYIIITKTKFQGRNTIMRHIFLTLTSAASLGLLTLTGQAAANPAGDIQQQFQNNQPQTAYETGLAAQSSQGEPLFDYWFGRAAFATEHFDVASFAFERVLIAQPGHQPARFYLAKSLQKLGQSEEAERIIDDLSDDKLNPEAARALSGSSPASNKPGSYRRFSLLGSYGFDSNANEGTDDTIFTFYNSDPPFDVDVHNRIQRLRDSFARFGLSAMLAEPINNTARWFFSGLLYKRINHDQKHVNNTNLLLKTGVALQHGKNEFRVPVSYSALRFYDGQGNRWFRKNVSVGLEYDLNFKPHTLTLFADRGWIFYPLYPTRDVYSLTGGAKWLYQLPQVPVFLTSTLYAGEHDARSVLGKRYGNTFNGIEVGANWKVSPKHTLYTDAGVQRRRYRAILPAAQKTRHDLIRTFNAGWQWEFAKDFLASIDYGFKEDHVNISVLGYQRNILEFTLEHVF